MLPQIGITLSGLFIVTQAATLPACEEFSRGVTFSSEQAVGDWYLLHLKHHNVDHGDTQCARFSLVTDEERSNLSSLLNKNLNIKWEKLVLKMQIPCENTGRLNRNRDYYLENLDTNGSYKTLQIPKDVKLDTAEFNRHPMRLKIVWGKYLAMLDCREHFIFLLDREPHTKQIPPALQKALEAYIPDEH